MCVCVFARKKSEGCLVADADKKTPDSDFSGSSDSDKDVLDCAKWAPTGYKWSYNPYK